MTEGERGRREAIAERLRELRGPRPQPWVAAKVGVSLRAYQAWEAGDSGIAWENIEALAKLWSVPEDYIVYGGDHGASPDQVTEMLTLLRGLDARLANVEKMLLEREVADLEDVAADRDRRRRRPPDTGEEETP